MDSAQALIIVALRAKAVENAVDHLQPEAVTVVTSRESLEAIIGQIWTCESVSRSPYRREVPPVPRLGW